MTHIPTSEHASDNDPAPLQDVGPVARLPEPALAADAIAQVLRPVARLMIDHGVQLPTMVELLKLALVQEAVGCYGLADKGSSDSRIALLTGVHRKDVKRLRETQYAMPVNPMVPVAASVVARWISDPRFLNADQSPRALPRTPTRGNPGEPDFPTLVSEISSDLGARAVLDELERLGAVILVGDSHVALRATAFVPPEGMGESFHFLANNVSDHLAASVHNLSPDRRGPPWLEQSAFSQDLSEPQAAQLHQAARRLWTRALQQFLQTATLAEQRSIGDTGPKHRVCFGVYFYDAVQAQETSAAPADASPRSKKKRKKQ